MVNLNLDQDVANKRDKENRHLFKLWPNFIQQAVGMRCYGSLIIITPLLVSYERPHCVPT